MFGFFNRNNGKVVNVNDIDNLIGKVEIIDIREPYEYSGGTIKTSKNIPMQTLLSNPDKYLKKIKNIIYFANQEEEAQEFVVS